jgi:hypothetical protein
MTKKEQVFNELINLQPKEIKDWIIRIDKLLTDNGCKASVSKDTFTYISPKTKKFVCKISIKEAGSTVKTNGIHLLNEDNILFQLPENMLSHVKNGKSCGVCAENNPNFVQCRHGGPFKFSYSGVDYNRCRFYPFDFSLEKINERKILEKWIELELS